MTTLQTFVSAAIQQFLGGIIQAQKSPVGEFVAPGLATDATISPEFGVAYHGGAMFTTMKFDVAVTADSSETSGVEGGVSGGLKVFEVGLSAKAKGSVATGNRFENVSRVQFAVHLKLPQP